MLNMNQISFIAEECRRQDSGELSVAWMCQAWEYATGFAQNSSAWDWQQIIFNLSKMVEPAKNNGIHYRIVPVTFANGNRIGSENISHQMDNLCAFLKSLGGASPEDAEMIYGEFEKIHPFKDGNGRVGKILFNLFNGTMENPVFPVEPNWM